MEIKIWKWSYYLAWATLHIGAAHGLFSAVEWAAEYAGYESPIAHAVADLVRSVNKLLVAFVVLSVYWGIFQHSKKKEGE